MKKVLIITYYWPPAGGSGVQRWLKFVKYFRDFGIEPVVYTVANPNYPIEDGSLKNEIPNNIEVLKQPIWEPNNLFSILKSKKQSAGFLNPNPSFFGKILQYVRANFFIPDARKFWIKPSVNYLKSYLALAKIDTIITTGPPHSLHLIGLQLKQTLNVKWIADFRDPWTEIDYFHQLPLSKKSIEKHQRLEYKVLKQATAVTVVGETMKAAYKKINTNTYVIANGFDYNVAAQKISLDKKFTLTHIGLMNTDRNHQIFWEAIKEIVEENADFKNELKVNLIGKIADDVTQSISKFNLENYVKVVPYLPHSKVIDYQLSSQVLLLFVNNVPSAKGIVTGKIFEYLYANRPILAIAPKTGDLANIIAETSAGEVVNFTEKDKLKVILLNWFSKFKKNSLKVNSKNIEHYHRRALTQKYASIIKQL